jgi:uncharacterized protein (TIGR02145 family)
MISKSNNLFCPVIVIGLILIFTYSCKKDEDSSIKITDVEGNVYKTVTIGIQVWMAENLRTTKYNNGDSIGTTVPVTLDIFFEPTPKYQWAYDGNMSNVATYGRLYTWYAVTDSRNVCPTGWHVPNDDEWHTLEMTLDADPYYSYGNGTVSIIAGGKLKETGTTHWTPPNKGATNETGFTALPGGLYYNNEGFTYIHIKGYWWSSTESTSSYGFFLSMNSENGDLFRGNSPKRSGLSVRCLRDN